LNEKGLTKTIKTYIIVGMKQIMFCLLFVSILCAGCVSEAAKTSGTSSGQAEGAGSGSSSSEGEAFNPLTISQELINMTRIDVRRYIEELNKVILSKNYEGWKEHLSQEYFDEISSDEFLSDQSEKIKMTKITIKTPQDYFNNIIVPSRERNRVDISVVDIEFSSQNRVTVFTIITKDEQRNILYELERSGSSWKIIK
jgi:hypothetical protein